MSISRGVLPLVLALLASPALAQPKTDLHGDPLPDKAVLRLGTVQYRLPGMVGMAFKKTGELVAVTDKLEVHTFPADGGPKATVTRLIDEPPDRSPQVAISPDAKYVAAFFSDRKELRVWDISGAKPELHHSRNNPAGSLVGFSPDGRRLWMTHGEKELPDRLQVLDLAAKDWRILPLPKNVRERWPVFTADGGRLIHASEGDVRVFDTATSEVVLHRTIPLATERASAFSPDGKVLAWVQLHMRDERAKPGKFQSVDTDEPVKGWTPPTATANQIGFTPGGKTLWVSDDDRLREWDPAAGKWAREVDLPIDYTSPVWSADGTRLACIQHSTIVFLDPKTWKVKNADTLTAGPTDTYSGVVVSPDGKVIATDGRVIHLWDAATGKLLARVKGAEGEGVRMAFLSGGKSFLMVSKNGQIAECESLTGKELRRFKTPNDLKGQARQDCLSLSADGKTFTTAARGHRVRWDVATGEETARIKLPTNRKEQESERHRSPDDRWVALGGWLWRTDDYPAKPPAVEVLSRQDSTGFGKCWSADSSLVTFGKEEKGRVQARSAGCSLLVYDVTRQAVQKELPTGWVARSAFSGDGKFLGVVTNDGVAVWDVAAGKRVFKADAPNPDGADHGIAFTPDGKRLVTTHGTAALVWDVTAK